MGLFCFSSPRDGKDVPMPRPMMDVNGPTYEAMLAAREMHRRYGPDWRDVLWAEKTLARLETRPPQLGYDAKDRADIDRIRRIYDRLAARKYSPNQPRVPAGNSDGGQWTDAGGQGGGGGRPSRILLPVRKPAPAARAPGGALHPPLSMVELDRFNSHAPPGTPRADLQVDPATGLPRWYAGGAVAPSLSPLDFLGARGSVRAIVESSFSSADIGGEALLIERQLKIGDLLHRSRNLPDDVVEVSRGIDDLTSLQKESLKRFFDNNRNYKPEIEIANYSDGRALFSFRVPGKVPGSFAVYEKQVSPQGKMIRTRKISIDPQGNLIHDKPK
jgi:hypothetical protein